MGTRIRQLSSGIRYRKSWLTLGDPGTPYGCTHDVDQNRHEDCAGDGRAVLWLVDAPNKLLMVVLEGEAQDGQNDDSKHRNDKAADMLVRDLRSQTPPHPVQAATGAFAHQDQACMAPTSGFMLGNCRF